MDTARRKEIERNGAPALGKVIVILDFSSNPHDTPTHLRVGEVRRTVDTKMVLRLVVLGLLMRKLFGNGTPRVLP